MKLHILNDLHIEFEDFDPPETDADIIILAGDIGVGAGGLEWAADHFRDKPAVYVPGNHEFYRHDIKLIDELKASAPANIHVLDNSQVVIGGVRFLGAILWTDFNLFGEAEHFFAMQRARESMADFSIIQNGGRSFTPEDAIKLHEQGRNWLESMLAEPFDGRTVVITHHAPSSRSVHTRYANDLLTPAFASNLESLMDRDDLLLWVHGHMHDPFDYEIYGTRVVCNPRGYSPDDLTKGFKPDFVIEI